MCVRSSDRPPSVRPHQNGPDLVTRNWVLALVTPSSATNSGSVRDAFDLVTRNWVLALVRALALEICVSVIRPFPVRDSEIPTESSSKTESSSPPQAIFLLV